MRERYKTISSEKQRQLLLRVADNVFDLWPLLEQLNSMRRSEEALTWLIRNNFTGKNLYDFWVKEKSMSGLQVMEFITQKLEKEDGARVLFYKRDIL